MAKVYAQQIDEDLSVRMHPDGSLTFRSELSDNEFFISGSLTDKVGKAIERLADRQNADAAARKSTK